MKKLTALLLIVTVSSALAAGRLVRVRGMVQDNVYELIEEGYDVTSVNLSEGYIDIMLPERQTYLAADISPDYEVLPREWSQLLPQNYRTAGEYYSVEENWAFWCGLAEDYSDLVDTPVTIGQSYENRDIYAISMTGPGGGYKPPLYFSSLIHAREPGGNSVLIDFAMWLTSNYDGGDTRAAYILDNATVYFVPVANPDGYIENMPGGGMHRKNMNFSDPVSSDGIDLNRNWGYQWGYDNSGSSGNPYDETYRGSAPFSEPENQVQRDFIIDLEPLIAMNYHTYGGYLLYPWGYEDITCPDDALFSSWAGAMTADNGYTYGTAWQVLYNVNGEQNDWCYSGQDVPKIYAMTPEVDDNGFWGSQNDTTEIERICDECRPMNILFCMLALDYVGIGGEEGSQIQPGLHLGGVYPNPVINSASFRVTAAENAQVQVNIYDTSGRIVDTFDAGTMNGGSNSVNWAVPSGIPAGLYTAEIIDSGGSRSSARFTVLK